MVAGMGRSVNALTEHVKQLTYVNAKKGLSALFPPAESKRLDRLRKHAYAPRMATFKEILDHFGGTHQSLADALGISREAVSMWDEEIPEGRAWQIESLSGGKFRFADIPVKGRRAVA